MSVDIWPPISPEELAIRKEESLARELEWILDETRTAMKDLKHGLEDCYALLAPIDPGSTLVLSTPRAEKVKGHVTRVGTRIVKGTIQLQLRYIQAQSVTLDPQHPIHIPELESLHTYLSESLDLLSITLSHEPTTPRVIADHLRALSSSLTSAAALLKGRPSLEPLGPDHIERSQTQTQTQTQDDQSSTLRSDTSWQTASCPPQHFNPPLPPNISFHLSLQDASLVLHLRGLEPVDAPVHLGTKLGLALGTFRRLEHDEMDQPYSFRYSPFTDGGAHHVHRDDYTVTRKHTGLQGSDSGQGQGQGQGQGSASRRQASSHNENHAVDVYVREKVRVETADPSLLSLYAKLVALTNTLAQARTNLAVVMGEHIED